VLKKPERWSRYKGITLAQVAAVAQEAGYDDPEVVTQTYEGIKFVARLSGDKVRELIQRLEGVNKDVKAAR